MKINIIAACDFNNLIGVDGKIPWSIKDDLKRFKELTMGHAVIMGRKTFESIGSKPLPGRINIVLSNNTDFNRYHDTTIFLRSFIKAKKLLDEIKAQQVFIIGGQQVYEEAMQYADTIYLTRVFQTVKSGENRRYFPVIPYQEWNWEPPEIHATHKFCIANRRDLTHKKVVTLT